MAKNTQHTKFSIQEIFNRIFDPDNNTIDAGNSGSGATATQLQGTAADNAAAVGNPVKTGGVYNTSAPTYANGDVADTQSDVNGNTKTTLATLIAGEDLTNDVQKVEQRFSYAYCAGADTQVKSGAGFLHTLTFTCIDAAPTAGTIIVYDNTAESGTIIYSETFTTTAFRGYTVIIDASFSTGLYVGFTTTNDVGVTVSYR